MSVSNVQTYPAASAADLSDYVGHGVKFAQASGKTVVSLWTDRATKPGGVIVHVDAGSGDVAVAVAGTALVEPAEAVTAGDWLTANNAGGDDEAKSTLAVAGSGHWPLCRVLQNGAAGEPTLVEVRVALAVLA